VDAFYYRWQCVLEIQCLTQHYGFGASPFQLMAANRSSRLRGPLQGLLHELEVARSVTGPSFSYRTTRKCSAPQLSPRGKCGAQMFNGTTENDPATLPATVDAPSAEGDNAVPLLGHDLLLLLRSQRKLCSGNILKKAPEQFQVFDTWRGASPAF